MWWGEEENGFDPAGGCGQLHCTMLRCENLTVRVAGGGPEILSDVAAAFQPRAMNAVIGPSGCGKTTLVKAMMGIIPATGKSFLGGQPIRDPEDLVGRVGFAPQFTTAQAQLTVEEAFQSALDLTVRDRAGRIPAAGAHGQLRRLGLRIELTLDPACMICDEVTSGLDPNSETQILDLLRRLVEDGGKTFLCIIHNLGKLDSFDWITVVHQGAVIFQGSFPQLLAYFEIQDALHLYDRMASEEIDYWRRRWAGFLAENPGHYHWLAEGTEEIAALPAPRLPGVASQLVTLLRRRFLLFFRDTGYFALTMAITFGFPVVVAIFAWKGLPAVPEVPLERVLASMEAFKQAMGVQLERAQLAGLASGLVMFQVILLTLMGANNGGREIAGERNLYEKERLIGLRPGAYVLSKVVFASAIALFQGVWMAAFVKIVCQFPGPWDWQLFTMAAVCVSMSIVCLGFSAVMQSAEKASLLSIYLVGFQIPLSGVVLALPEALEWLCRPFINAYWGWAGFMRSMHAERIYDAYVEANRNSVIMDTASANGVLLVQALVGVMLIVIGCHRRRSL